VSFNFLQIFDLYVNQIFNYTNILITYSITYYNLLYLIDGKAMSMSLPEGNYKFMGEREMEGVPDDIRVPDDIHGFMESTRDSWETGFILEVDMEISPDDHDKFCDYPPAPKSRCVQPKEMSAAYQQPMIADLLIGSTIYRTPKLVADLNNFSHFQFLWKDNRAKAKAEKYANRHYSCWSTKTHQETYSPKYHPDK
jgi:hypothetical protein